LKDGVIADLMLQMISLFIKSIPALKKNVYPALRMVCIPSGITEK
jgi:actin-like ATPase involved in cell morphogenesis